MSGTNLIIGLPDDVMYNILRYIEAPNNIAFILCHSITPLCKAAKTYVESNDNLWEAILSGYYVNNNDDNDTNNDKKRNHSSNQRGKSDSAFRARTQRRSSKRLRRTTAREDVIHAHFVLRDQTEMALQEVADLAISKTPHPLSLSRLRAILNTYGPNLNINQRSAIGGTFLVDVIRARCIKESVILSCVKELMLVYHASPYIPATEGAQYQRMKQSSKKTTIASGGGSTNSKNVGNLLPPLVVAAARGMPTVVKYLLSYERQRRGKMQTKQNNTNHNNLENEEVSLESMEGSSRFRLFVNPKKSICGTYTPLEFACKMKEAEIEHGASENDLRSLNQCIRLLSSGK